MDENMVTIIVAIVSSTALSTTIGAFLQPFIEGRRFKREKEKLDAEREYEEKKAFFEKKEKAYLGAILYSLYAKNIIEAYRDIDTVNRDEIKKLHEEINKVFWEVTPAIRLYCNTLTFQSFRRITRIAKASTFKTIQDESNLRAMDGEVDFFVDLIKKDLGIKE